MMNGIHNLSTESQEEIRMYESLLVEIVKGSFPTVLLFLNSKLKDTLYAAWEFITNVQSSPKLIKSVLFDT